MMKFILPLITGLIGLLVIAMTAPATAQESPTMTDEHVARIKSNCRLAIATLGQIHANDAPVYINYIQTYYSISDKLMARLNSRLTLNRYDATQLVGTASEFNDTLADFRRAYRLYDEAMNDLIRMDCRSQPVTFYDRVSEARELRQNVQDITQKMSKYIDEYLTNVRDFRLENDLVKESRNE